MIGYSLISLAANMVMIFFLCLYFAYRHGAFLLAAAVSWLTGAVFIAIRLHEVFMAHCS
jgi:hypothetical protein